MTNLWQKTVYRALLKPQIPITERVLIGLSLEVGNYYDVPPYEVYKYAKTVPHKCECCGGALEYPKTESDVPLPLSAEQVNRMKDMLNNMIN